MHVIGGGQWSLVPVVVHTGTAVPLPVSLTQSAPATVAIPVAPLLYVNILLGLWKFAAGLDLGSRKNVSLSSLKNKEILSIDGILMVEEVCAIASTCNSVSTPSPAIS